MNTDNLYNLLDKSLLYGKDYIKEIQDREVFPSKSSLDNLKIFDEALPKEASNAADVIKMLHETGSPATVASTGGRYFGFVTGGVNPVAAASELLSGIWDQNAGLIVSSPLSAKLEKVTLDWILELLKLPKEASAGFVTGTTMANFTALASARHYLLKLSDYNVEDDGLFGAPIINVIVGEEAHVTVFKALSLLGLGRKRIITVPSDSQGRMDFKSIPSFSGPSIICTQAGNVNSGSFDPIYEICKKYKNETTWIHVDGAFGLWANVSHKYSHLTKGIELADSWSTDFHKWLNVPYDSGIVIVKDNESIKAAMSLSANYLKTETDREPFHYTPETSRKSRAVNVWATLKSMGACGVKEIVERNCSYAKLVEEEFRQAGYEILNDVVLNQVLIHFRTDEITEKVISEVQKDGTCWCGPTKWKGKSAMRFSISSWITSEDDILKSISAILKIASQAVTSG